MKRLAIALLLFALIAPARAGGEASGPGGTVFVDLGRPEAGPGRGERIVAETGVPHAGDTAHVFASHVARALGATRFWEGDYDLDELVRDIADPGRRDGRRPKITTLVFAGHTTWATANGEQGARWHILAGRYELAADITAHLVPKLRDALDANALAAEDVFAPGALIEFKVCFVASRNRPFVEDLASLLPPDVRIKAYGDGYAYSTAGFGWQLPNGASFRPGVFDRFVGLELGDQKKSLVVIEGSKGGGARSVPRWPWDSLFAR